MKASNKMWLSHHSAHDYKELVSRWKALAKKVGLEIVSISQQADYEVMGLRGGEQGDNSGLYLSAGVHGDEPAAVWALLEWAEVNQKLLRRETIAILPCVNPWGFVHNRRLDPQGRDLNRMFQNKTLPFFRGWRKFIGEQQFRMALNLHEDYDAQGVYVYELASRGKKISEPVFDHSNFVIPPEGRSYVDGRKIKRGIIRHSGSMQRLVEEELDGGWPEAVYLYQYHAKAALTFETPSEFAFHERVKAQMSFIAGAIKSVDR